MSIGIRAMNAVMLRGAQSVLVPLAVSSCALVPRDPVAPVRAIVDEPSGRPSELVVLLPGRWSKPEEFREEGFLELVRERHPQARIVAPDLHLGYYRARSVIDRLHHDIVLPARRDGIRELTLVGISMGGLGAVLYDLEHPKVGKRLVLLSPFLGEREVIDEIDEAGGLAAWRPETPSPADFSRRVWVGLKERWRGPAIPEVWLGCGREDRLAATSRLAEREFPGIREVLWVPGGHDWAAWRALYGEVSPAAARAR